MATTNMHNLTTLIKRLEAATSRLEDMASVTVSSSASTTGSAPGPTTINTTPSSTTPVSTSTPKAATPQIPPAIEGFDALINGEVKQFVSKSEKLGGIIADQAESVRKAFAAERKYLLVTTKSKKPDITSPVYMEILKDLQTQMEAVNGIRVANRASLLFNHLNTVSEGIAMLGWITIEPKPVDYVTDTLNSAQFYGNRVTKEFKEKDPSHVEWVHAYYSIFKSLLSYIKEYHSSGVAWNSKDGVDPKEALRLVETGDLETPISGSAAPAPGPPPPPPLPTFDNVPPPPPGMPPKGPAKAHGAGDMGAVFEQISQGESVTAGLRKVDPSQQTHKNPSLRASSSVPPASAGPESPSPQSPGSRGKSPLPGRKPQSMRAKKPPRKELDGNKWIIENFESPDGVIEIEGQINHSVLISRCVKTTVRVINKANAISIDSSSQVSLVIDSLVSSVDVIKTPRFEMQVLGTLPTILLDQVDGASIYLSRNSLDTEVFTSKCTAVNINVPGPTDEDDYRECPVPEQLKTIIRHGVVCSEIVEHAG